MTTHDDSPAFAHGVQATTDLLEEIVESRAVVSLKRDQVVSVAFARASAAERPVLEATFGLIVMSAGSWLARHAALAVWSGVRGNGMPLIRGGGVIMAVLALGLIPRVARKTDVLVVELADGERRKLAFDAPLTPDTTARFQEELRELGWPVRSATQ